MSAEKQVLLSASRYKEFVVDGQLVAMRDKRDRAPARAPAADEAARARRLPRAEILTIEEVAAQPIEGLDTTALLKEMANVGPEARLLLYRVEGSVTRHEVFEDPRICHDLHRGAVIENLAEKPKDVSGWRTHEFSIDIKGCLGEECGRCAVMCPENAIHLVGKGKGSFHEIDPLACKGCFICWVECFRTAADCILVDGKTFDPAMRVKHFGE
ncbi:MAG TPA: hypothetical protein VNN77_06780 [candidate division Zixibacteria bacterium]|nr:hypothetical protein [candidate division Zixibacteria bacterium]